MIEIRHKETGEVLRAVESDSLVGADLRDDVLDGADLSRANIQGAQLMGAVLRRADVTDADFKDVSLVTVNVTFANFSRAKNAELPAFKQNIR
jgi:uncharacterized protein YjbI with pentapeptide repeats